VSHERHHIHQPCQLREGFGVYLWGSGHRARLPVLIRLGLPVMPITPACTFKDQRYSALHPAGLDCFLILTTMLTSRVVLPVSTKFRRTLVEGDRLFYIVYGWRRSHDFSKNLSSLSLKSSCASGVLIANPVRLDTQG
jgi:hypothetical protein